MQNKNLITIKTFVFSLLVFFSISFTFSFKTFAQTKSVNFVKTSQQDEPSKRFGTQPTYKPSIRYMPTASYKPSKRLGEQQVGEASLEVVKRKIVKAPLGPEELVLKTDKLLESGQIEKAIESYRKIIESNPKLASAQLGLATALIEKGDYEEALNELSKALNENPNSPEAQINYGVALYRSGDIKKALEHYEKILNTIKDKNDLASLNYNLAVAHSHNGNFEKALTHYKKSIELRTHYPEAYNNLGLIYEATLSLTDPKESEKNREQIRNAFLTAIEQRKGSYPLARYNLGRTYTTRFELKTEYPIAISHYLAAIKEKPDFAEAYLDLGVAYLFRTTLADQDEINQAINAFQKALEIRKGDYAIAHENLAIAFSIKGKEQETYFHYRKAIDQYKEPSSCTLSNLVTSIKSLLVEKKNSFLIGNELSRSEDVRNLRKTTDPKLIREALILALQKYDELDDELKENATLHYCAGHAQASLGNWEEALDEFAKVLELSKEKDQDTINAIREILSLIEFY